MLAHVYFSLCFWWCQASCWQTRQCCSRFLGKKISVVIWQFPKSTALRKKQMMKQLGKRDSSLFRLPLYFEGSSQHIFKELLQSSREITTRWDVHCEQFSSHCGRIPRAPQKWCKLCYKTSHKGYGICWEHGDSWVLEIICLKAKKIITIFRRAAV